MVFSDIYRGKRVLVTGHTGFKGSWLCEWLCQLGAEVTGFSKDIPTTPSLFEQLGLASRLRDCRGDVRDLSALSSLIHDFKPEFVFHLAAQSLVRLSYEQPVETYSTNVLGTVNVLESVRQAKRPCAVVCVTTDKCYENKEWVHSYREEDAMGGHDPYSSSKGAAEIAISSYRRSFFSAKQSHVRVASARAGNVIGGGDWALDRIVPDCIRALQRGEAIPVRNKVATRPWQHVLEPLSGYLALAAKIHQAREKGEEAALDHFCSGYNFGPALNSNRTVADLVTESLKHWPGAWEDTSDPNAVHEATLLNLATDKAFHFLKWQPVWEFPQTIERTVSWYRHCSADSSEAASLTARQITDYQAAAKLLGIAWAKEVGPKD